MPRMKAVWIVALLCCSAAALPVLGQEAAAAGAQATAAAAESDTSADAAADAALATLNSEIKTAEEEQSIGDDHKTDVFSTIIDEIDPGLLASGDGDVSTTGACSDDVAHFCTVIKPGEGRVYECLKAQREEEKMGNSDGRTISEDCRAEMVTFGIERAININNDVPLARACRKDVNTLCKAEKKEAKAKSEPALVVACLKEHDGEVSEGCNEELFRVELEAAADYRTDAELNKYCQADAKQYCPDVEPGDGRVQDCLREQPGKVSFDCNEELHRQEVQDAGDIRLSIVLLRTCMADKQQFCAHVPYGNAAVKDCLEESREQEGFTPECKQELETMMERRAKDVRLDIALMAVCQEDIEQTCGRQFQTLDQTHNDDGRVIKCLQDFKDELKEPACADQVHKVMMRAASNIRFNMPLASACADDREQFCGDVQPGSARVIRCLQDNREQLNIECSMALFDQEVRMAEDIDFKLPVRQACAAELEAFCGEVRHGHARRVRCLQDHLEDESMGEECADQVRNDEERSSQDSRLNYRLSQACSDDLGSLCSDVCNVTSNRSPCGGLALRCLQDKQDEVTSEECQKEIFYFEKMEADDYRNDPVLAEACHQDVLEFCDDVEPGGGRVMECLRAHREDLSTACRAEELHLNIVQARDVRLRPKLRKICAHEVTTHCKDVKPGQGRVFQCLQEHLAEVDFSAACREQVEDRWTEVQSDYRLDYGVSEACEGDVKGYCADAAGRVHGKAEVLRCLIAYHDHLTNECATETSRAARLALWDYQPKAALTQYCDGDVGTYCALEKDRSRGVWSIGAVGRCLAKQLALGSRLNTDCEDMIRAAAPADSRAVIDAKSAQLLVTNKVKELQQAVQDAAAQNAALVNANLIDPEAMGLSMITLTGWVAAAGVAAAAMLGVLAVVWGCRRLSGRDHRYTVIKPRDGDV